MVWVEPDPIPIDDVDDWKIVEQKKYLVLQHLETVHVSEESEAEKEIPFCYRIVLKTKSNFIVGIARNFPAIRKNWLWIEEHLQVRLQTTF